MMILMSANHSGLGSKNMITETSRQFLSKQLARVIAIDQICLFLFIAFCTVMTFGSP